MSQKSLISKFAETILNMTKPDYMDNQEMINKFLAEKSKINEKPVKSIFKSTDFDGMKVSTFWR